MERDYFWDAPSAVMGAVRQLGSPMRFAETRVRRDRSAPLLGEDTRAILSEIGCSEAEIGDLLRDRVAAEPQRATPA